MINESEKKLRKISDEKVAELYKNLLQREPNKDEMDAFHFGFLVGITIKQ